MGSRIRENVTHFFECFCEVVPPHPEKESWIIQKYPENYNDDELLKAVPKFTYPFKIENTVIQHYSFVLTNSESKWTFGFCRHDPNSETAIVVLSYLPWHNDFFRFLDITAPLMHSTNTDDLREFLSTSYNIKIAEPGKSFSIFYNKGDAIFTIDVPKPFQLPSIPENSNLTEYYNAVDTNNMITIFASMLFERRIIIKSKKLRRLSACVQSANDIIYPMTWQHIFIPILPMQFIDCLLAPMPFLIGVPEEVMKKVNRTDIGEVVILDADNNSIETPFDDLSCIPAEVIGPLKKQLKNKSTLLGDAVSRAFLRALVHLIGGYRDALKFQPGRNVTFDEETFIQTRSASLKPFIKEMLNLQIFRQFIEERLTMLNNGLGFSDEFEVETFKFSEKSSSKLKQQYKDWTSTMKKEGSAFFRSVKDKANPAVKNAVKTVKDGGKGVKSAYKGLRSRLKENHSTQLKSKGINEKPLSAPSSPVSSKRRLPSFSLPATTAISSYKKDSPLNFKSSPFERSYSPLSSNSRPCSPFEETSRSESPDIPRIDLMHEMQDLLKLHLETPPIDRSLKPVRSLENFKHDSPSPQHNFAFLNNRNPASETLWPSFPLSKAPLVSPSHFFSPGNKSKCETEILLQSPEDTVLSPPPVPPRKDLFGTAPFIVGGGRAENGDPLFFVATDRHTVDVVKLSPPVANSTPRRKKNEETEDLITLDSCSDIDDFDPLKSKSANSSFLYQTDSYNIPLSVSNPLYTYENRNVKSDNANTDFVKDSAYDRDLLQEYGIDFNSFSNQKLHFEQFKALPGSSKVNTQNNWTKFD